MRNLETIANATPKDYLEHKPKDPEALALMMRMKAERLFPFKINEEFQDVSYSFFYMGPGSGLVIQNLIDNGHQAYGAETSKRGISTAPDLVRNYVLWILPWELSARNKQFHVALISSYYKELFAKDEWNATLKELKRVSKYQAVYPT